MLKTVAYHTPASELCLRSLTDGTAVGRPQPMQLVLLGTGDAWMEAALHGLAMSYPGWAVGVAEFQVPRRCRLAANANLAALWSRGVAQESTL